MSEFTFPFRRMTRGVPIPVNQNGTASSYEMPPGFFDNMTYSAFLVVNPNTCWVGLRGTSMPQSGPAPTEAVMASADGLDWLWPPHHIAVYSTQHPMFMSAIALPMPDFPIPAQTVPVRLYYGFGS